MDTMRITFSINWVAAIIMAMFPVFSNLNAQLDSVKYVLEYNPVDDEFDMKIVIAGGSANTVSRRTQANAQITIVVPTGADIEIKKRFMPLRNNQNFTGTEPNQWDIGSTVKSPPIRPQFDFYAFVPGLSPSSQYNTLKTGDTIRLFSLKIRLTAGCFEDIQLFDKTMIPEGSPWGFGDFSQGFTVGGVKQLYRGNLKSRNKKIQNRSFTMQEGQELILASTAGSSGTWRKWFTSDKMSLEEIAPGVAVVKALQNETGTYTFICQNDTITDIACVSVMPATSAYDNPELREIRFSPNPTQDVLYLQGGKWDCLEIRDLSGKRMMHETEERRQFDISAWTPGVYIASIRNGLQVMIVKLVKL